MRKTESAVKNTLSQYQDDFLMFGKYSVKSLKTVIDTLNSLHDRQTELEKLVTTKLFTEVKRAGDALDYSVELQLFLELAKEEHVTKYKEVDKAGRELLDAIAILSQRRLPRSLFPDQRLKGILTEVDKTVKKNYPYYELAANHISHYRDMELVTFSVDRVTHSLIVTFPVFIKDFKQPTLSLFEIETVPVPIPDKNKQADSYSQVIIQMSYIAAGMDYYIQIRMTEMLMCKSIGYIYYCEELKCTSINGVPAKPAPKHTYAVVNREFFCDCQLDLEHPSVLRQPSSCNKEKCSKLVMQFHINIAFWELLKKKEPINCRASSTSIH